MDWSTIETKVAQDDQNKWDAKVWAGQLSMRSDGKLNLASQNGNGGSFALTPLATQQLCLKLEIPVRYFRRLPEGMRAFLVNYELTCFDHRTHFLLRGRGEKIRAFLSARYVTYNNAQVIEAVASLLREAPVQLRRFILDDSQMYLKIIGLETVEKSCGLRAGVMIGNSEVGLSPVTVEPFVFRQPCTNDLVVADEITYRHRHIHVRVSELASRLAEAIKQAFDAARSLSSVFRQSRDDIITGPVETIKRLGVQARLSEPFVDRVVESYDREPEPTLFGVINAFTRAAHELPPLARIDVERFAGRVLMGKVEISSNRQEAGEKPAFSLSDNPSGVGLGQEILGGVPKTERRPIIMKLRTLGEWWPS